MKYAQQWQARAIRPDGASGWFPAEVPGNVQYDYGRMMGWGRPIQGIMAVVPPAACQKPDPQTAGGCREGAQESIKARWELGWNGVGEGCGGRLVGDQGSSVQEVGMP